MSEMMPLDVWAAQALESRCASDSELIDAAVRRQAFANSPLKGIPEHRREEWKYTDIKPLLRGTIAQKRTLSEPSAEEARPYLLSDKLGTPEIVFVDGVYSSKLSKVAGLPEGVFFGPMTKRSPVPEHVMQHLTQYADWRNEPFAALNTALAESTVLLWVRSGVELKDPMHVLFLSTSAFGSAVLFPRLLVLLEHHSSASLIESHIGLSAESYLSCPVAELVLEDSAHLDHIKIQREGSESYHISTLQGAAESNASLSTLLVSTGAKLARNELFHRLTGDAARSSLQGLTLMGEHQHLDNNTVVDHAAPHGESEQVFRGVYGDSSVGIFTGTIIVRHGAQKTNAFQSNRSVMLSQKSKSISRPQLKIWADDVKCSHGATVGQLNSEALFYLRSRGVPEADARNMLLHAFASEALSGRQGEIRDLLEALVVERLEELTIPEPGAESRG